ncbi:hypothetical protein MLD38_025706 [Melastoma candidum]|uniref:Uncharacterized protein n=1 Tax=Melastoma candidum TaxID=119954 RepID=A0ACB9NZP4_9MYRT|nr:hypothetical protein MLD38_025706 [Melastoma candidum]
MDYNFRNNSSYRPPPPSSSSSPMYGHSVYPRVGGQTQPASPAHRPSPYHHPAPPPSSSSSGLGIRVFMKPEYRITPPPNLAPLAGDIPRSNFQYDFDFEKKVLAEAEKETPNWNKLAAEIIPARSSEPIPPLPSQMGDPVVGKFVASGLSREAVSIAVANYGDNPVKVREFAGGYNLLREMGFSSDSVAEALFMHENDKDKALAYLLNCSS